jgi:hypothetical protein
MSNIFLRKPHVFHILSMLSVVLNSYIYKMCSVPIKKKNVTITLSILCFKLFVNAFIKKKKKKKKKNCIIFKKLNLIKYFR